MKNVTITLDEKVARWVRVWAAENDTSVSRFVGEVLKERMNTELAYKRAHKRFMGKGKEKISTSGKYPTREELHDRDLLR